MRSLSGRASVRWRAFESGTRVLSLQAHPRRNDAEGHDPATALQARAPGHVLRGEDSRDDASEARQEASDAELTRAFTAHQKETEKHVANLEKVFKHVGESAQAHPCPGIEGIKKEHDEFMKENEPSPQMRDAFLTGAAARAEHYEIAAYTGLVNQARALGEREAVELLQQNLRQEKEALKKVESISKRLLKESNGSKNGSSSRRSSGSQARAKSGASK